MRSLSFLLAASLLPLSAEPVILTARERSLSTTSPSQSAEIITLAAGDLATVNDISPNAYLDVKIGATAKRFFRVRLARRDPAE